MGELHRFGWCTCSADQADPGMAMVLIHQSEEAAESFCVLDAAEALWEGGSDQGPEWLGRTGRR